LYAFNILAQSAYDFAFNNDFATADKLQTLSSIDYFWLKVAFVILVGLPLELWLIWKIGTSIRSIVDSSYLAKQVYKKNHSKFTLNTCIINEDGIEIKTPDAQSAFYSWGEFISYSHDEMLFFLRKLGKEPYMILPVSAVSNIEDQTALIKLIE